MTSIRINTAKPYDVYIGYDLISQIGEYACQISKPCKVAVICDSNVAPIFSPSACCSLQQTGFTCYSFTFPAGEDSKNPETYFQIVSFLAENHFTRSDLIIALGGGVTGDIAGFAAATYQRGISYIQIPTSLLAMVDSSVGGKTAIDLPSGKNMIGAFHQPALVLCDLEAINTLPEAVFRDGCAEIIKYGILFDETLFSHLEDYHINFHKEHVISRCIELKNQIVTTDEYDTGMRQLLNLGHTFGHGVEAASHYTISHGQAVAIGLALIAKIACAFFGCEKTVLEKVHSILDMFGLPTKTSLSAEHIYKHALSDKKRSANTLNLVIPHAIANCAVHNVPISEVRAYLEAGLK